VIMLLKIKLQQHNDEPQPKKFLTDSQRIKKRPTDKSKNSLFHKHQTRTNLNQKD